MTTKTLTPGRPRTLAGSALDALAGMAMRLPPARTGYTLARDVPIPMRDGVTLAGDVYLPTSPLLGTVLVQGPYGRSLPFSLQCARLYAVQGYAVCFVSTRGTFGSGGDFDPMTTEVDDGHDTVRWLTAQPWFTGSFATLGASYLGFTQWALLADPPEEMAAVIVVVGPHDFARHAWGTGAFNLDLLGWSDMVAHQEDGGPVRVLAGRAARTKRLRALLDAVPLVDAADAYFAGRAPWVRERLTRPDLSDPFWAPMALGAALDRAEVPVLLIGGWQDLFLGQTVEQYRRLRRRGVEVALTVGPWTHVQLAGTAAGTVGRESLDWLDEHLARRSGRRRPAPVRVFVNGAGAWRDLPSWPPETTQQAWYLHPGGGLAPGAPAADAQPSSFTFDPAHPTPTVGGPMLEHGGVVEDTELAVRPDVLSFTGPPLDRPLTVLGGPVVELVAGGDTPHRDLFVRLSEVGGDGRSRNVTEGYRRLDPGQPEGLVVLRLRDTAHRFAPGSRLRLFIAGGSHPQYSRNLGTGEDATSGSAMRPARHTVAHGRGGASRLVLPVAPG